MEPEFRSFAHEQFYYQALWLDLAVAYAISTVCCLAIFYFGLSKRHALKARVFAAIWLPSSIVPLIWLVKPYFFYAWSGYLNILVAQILAIVLFWSALGERSQFGKRSMWSDFASIGLASVVCVVGSALGCQAVYHCLPL